MSYRHQEKRHDFSGGWNARDRLTLLTDSESPDMQNVMIGKRGTIEPRNGISLFRDDPVTAGFPVTSIYQYINNASVSNVLVAAGGRLRRAGFPWVTIHDVGLDEHAFYEFATHPGQDLALFVNGHDGYWETDADTASPVMPYVPQLDPEEENFDEWMEYYLPGPAKLIEYHNYRVWLANFDDFPDRVYMSVDNALGDSLYNYFSAEGWIRATNSKGEGITAIKSFKDSLLVFTPTTIKAIVGDTLAEYEMRDISLTVGTISNRSLQIVGGNLVFLGVDGVYMFDGQSQPFKISQRIDPVFEEMSPSWRGHACATTWGEKYLLSIPTSTSNDTTLMYDTDIVPLEYIGEQHSYANNPWTPHRGFYPWQWLYDRNLNLFFASDDGYVYKYDVGDLDGEEMIEAYYTTKPIDLDAPDLRKRVRVVDVDAESFENSFMRIEYRIDDEEEWKLLAELNQEEEGYRFINFPNWRPLCRKIQFKFSNAYTGCRFRLNAFSLDMAVHGQRKE